MVDWNVNPSPLDGAVVGTRERWGWGGGLACTLTSIKTVISQPVCALTDHSKHYAQHRGWTTLDYSTEIMFFLFVFFRRHPPESGDNAGQTPLQVFKTIECCIFTCWVLRAYISVMSLFISFPESAVLQCHCPSCCPVSCLPLLTKRRRRGRNACARSLREIRSSGWLGSLLWRKRASRRHQKKKPNNTSRSFPHITSTPPRS